MTEREMEDLLWAYPQKFLNEPLDQFQRQPSSGVGRADLVFSDRIDRLLVVELKRDTLARGAIAQIVDYYGMMKSRFPEKSVELMVIANRIPLERRLACERHDIIAVEIPEKKFRDVAAEVGYAFKSETPQNGASTPDTMNTSIPLLISGNQRISDVLSQSAVIGQAPEGMQRSRTPRKPKRDPEDRRVSLDAVIETWRVAQNKRQAFSGYWLQGGEKRLNRSGGSFFAVAVQKNFASIDAAQAALARIKSGEDHLEVLDMRAKVPFA
jgi:hypothetical protein